MIQMNESKRFKIYSLELCTMTIRTLIIRDISNFVNISTSGESGIC